MRKAARTLQWLLPSGKDRCTSVRRSSTGIDSLRQVLQQLRHDVEVEARPPNANATVSSLLPPPAGASVVDGSGCTKAQDDPAGGLRKSAVLIKELLRIFTRKVPGGLVPDGLVRGFMQAYSDLKNPLERLAFFNLVAQEMGLSVTEVTSVVRLWDAVQARHSPPVNTPLAAAAAAAAARGSSPPPPAPSPPPVSPAAAVPAAGSGEGASDAAYRAADRIVSACRPLYSQLFVPISQAPQGIKFLVDLRGDLLQLAAVQQASPAPAAAAPLRAMAEHLRQSLAEWFAVGLLQLQPVSWAESPAALLERVMRCEAVHPLGGSWDELRRRLGPRRRVFAFTHPCMPGEPLVVLHTALLTEPAAAMSDILAADDEGAVEAAERTISELPPPTAAVFYSISASQPGLRGIDLGQFLIKRVAERLMAEYPSIRRLLTLSPLPNFRAWLISRLRQEAPQAPTAPPPSPLPSAAPRAQPDGDAGGIGGDGGGGRGGVAPLLRPHEAEAVVRLAQTMGWTGSPYGGGAGDGGGSGGGVRHSVGSDDVRGQGYTPDGGASTATLTAPVELPFAPPPPSAAAAAALCWLLEGDRWLSGPDASGHSERCAATAPTSDAGSGGGGAAASESGAGAVVVLRPLLLRLAARYLVEEKRRRFALCPVAHFHLRNGASAWRLNWRADMSPLGLSRSCGIMVNYEYELPCVYDNNWKYIMLHEVQAHPLILQLLRGA